MNAKQTDTMSSIYRTIEYKPDGKNVFGNISTKLSDFDTVVNYRIRIYDNNLRWSGMSAVLNNFRQ